jgi:NADH-quinone oxidoreductase subunit H
MGFPCLLLEIDPSLGFIKRIIAWTAIEEILPFKQNGWLLYLFLALVAAVLLLVIMCVFGLFAVWLERKVSAYMQCRLGPMEVGRYQGCLQTIADALKLAAKEDFIPKAADMPIFILAPILAFSGILLAFLVIPFDRYWVPADLNVGLFYFASMFGIEAFGIFMAGWASNNKWALFGAMRLVAQLISYEIPLGLCLLTIVAITGSLSVQDVCLAQSHGVLSWYIFRNPFMWILFLIFFTATLAECKRAPFDLPEAESELVAGFHTEYSGMRFAMFFLAEYAAMYVVSCMCAILFFGGWSTGISLIDRADTPLAIILRILALNLKALSLVFVQMWLRWTLPRIRLDQVMYCCLKVLLPISMFCFLAATVWEFLFRGHFFRTILG